MGFTVLNDYTLYFIFVWTTEWKITQTFPDFLVRNLPSNQHSEVAAMQVLTSLNMTMICRPL